MLKRSLLLVFLLAPALLPALASRTVVDETGRQVVLPDHPSRIICLAPSITDAIYSIGAGAEVVGISDYVEFPAEARSKPSVGTISSPSMEAILALHPDLILGMPQANDEAVLQQLRHLRVAVYLVDPHGVAGILHAITSLGQATHREAQATAEVARLGRRIAAVQARVKGKPIIDIFMPLSSDPLVTIGRGAFITEIVTLAGGHSITADLDQEWPVLSMESLVARAPQALLLVRGDHLTVLSLKDRPGWKTLPAVRSAHVFYVDKRIDFPSPVAIDALEDLAAQFHP